ncbi:carboxypeptidase inhibitor SmCI-like [Dermacentor albipictus]|uniref:carboxypeptidase inhibitor SmCI-like n=1 Tax=Dermacentor albipictus TaxID=60249 RepID=UPI0031FD82B4
MDVVRYLPSLLLLMGICCVSSNNDYSGSSEEWETRQAPSMCQKPPRSVRTSTARLKWFYNVTAAQCEKFYTDMQDAGRNSFETIEACNKECRDEHYGMCGGPKNDSLCKERPELRFWFDPDSRKCQYYMYGGCDENSNTFRTKLDCLTECAEFINDACSLPIDEGDCFLEVVRFGFNTAFQSCEQFVYTGCGGNRNNFKDAKSCWMTCARNSRCLKYTQKNTQWFRPFTSYFYDADTNECTLTRTFFRKKKGPKYNRFPNKAECERVCKRKHTPIKRYRYMK